MQTNPKIQNSYEDVELSLDENFNEQVTEVDKSESQDEAELSAVEMQQAENVEKAPKATSSIKITHHRRKETTMYTAVSMAAGVFVVVAIYAGLVFM